MQIGTLIRTHSLPIILTQVRILSQRFNSIVLMKIRTLAGPSVGAPTLTCVRMT